MCFFFNDTATTEIYTLSLHDALPISEYPKAQQRNDFCGRHSAAVELLCQPTAQRSEEHTSELQSANISYAVFCLKKKKDVGQTYAVVKVTRGVCRHGSECSQSLYQRT